MVKLDQPDEKTEALLITNGKNKNIINYEVDWESTLRDGSGERVVPYGTQLLQKVFV